MPRSKRQAKRPVPTHTHLAIRVNHYDAHVSAAINHHAYAPEYAWNLDEDDPVYAFTARLTIEGVATYPDDRAGQSYELTISGDDAPSREHNLRLRDVQAHSNSGSPQYRQYRGRTVPVYDPPDGMGFLDKVRGEPRWTGWIFVATRFVQNALAVLDRERAVYVALHEYRERRTRWIRSLSLQTTDPAEE